MNDADFESFVQSIEQAGRSGTAWSRRAVFFNVDESGRMVLSRLNSGTSFSITSKTLRVHWPSTSRNGSWQSGGMN